MAIDLTRGLSVRLSVRRRGVRTEFPYRRSAGNFGGGRCEHWTGQRGLNLLESDIRRGLIEKDCNKPSQVLLLPMEPPDEDWQRQQQCPKPGKYRPKESDQ